MERDIVGIGECLVDFVTQPYASDGQLHMAGTSGGAPANTLAMAARLGRHTAFVGKVGRDAFGNFIKDALAAAGVDTAGLVYGPQPTTLAMVHLGQEGESSYQFYRNATADVMLQRHEVDEKIVQSGRIFHFGPMSMTQNPAREATLWAVQAARAAGAVISYDANYRPAVWNSEDGAKEILKTGMQLADVAKLNEEEARMLSGEHSAEAAAVVLQARYNLRLVAVTLGQNGCIGASQTARVHLPAFRVRAQDTTGAGDAFWGAVLHRLLEDLEAELSAERLSDILRYGNAAGALCATADGAQAGQPTRRQIERLIALGKMRS